MSKIFELELTKTAEGTVNGVKITANKNFVNTAGLKDKYNPTRKEYADTMTQGLYFIKSVAIEGDNCIINMSINKKNVAVSKVLYTQFDSSSQYKQSAQRKTADELTGIIEATLPALMSGLMFGIGGETLGIDLTAEQLKEYNKVFEAFEE